MYKVLICGDRNYSTEYSKAVRKVIRELAHRHGTKDLLLIEGGAPGIDTLVKLAGQAANIHVAEVQALWDTRGRSAGPQRNKVMAALEPHEVIAIHSSITDSVGTAGMLRLASELGIPTRLIEC